ncbi:MAG: HD domain-containing protein [Chloroflexi bacterium]|nr:HD domain-containing protein [Chloroflexota bacterium]
MTIRQTDASQPSGPIPHPADDPVLFHLEQAELLYRELRAEADRRAGELAVLQPELATARTQLAEAHSDLLRTQTELTNQAGALDSTQAELSGALMAIAERDGQLRRLSERLAGREAELDSIHGQLTAMQAEADRLRHELQSAREELEQTRSGLRGSTEQNESLARALELAQGQSEQQRRQATRHRDRADQLAAKLKEIHRALFSGNVYDLILRTCLTLTNSRRGLYVTAHGEEDLLRVRAAVDVDGYPAAPPSPFLRALCQKVLDSNHVFVCNRTDAGDLPEPSVEGERFRNCAVVPTVILKNFDGIVIVADKVDGDFDEDDVELLLSVGDQAAVAVENARLQRELQHAYLATVSALADAVEAKDAYTFGHCEEVSRYARLIAQRLGLSEAETSLVCYAALLHDVGKIGVSDGVLNKPGALLPEELELMRSHVRVGHDLLSHVAPLRPVAGVVLHLHERYDGNGYPDGLSAEEIPIASRIVCVVDAYCAMITRRSYKDAFSDERARAELRRCAGTQFDPRIVELFLEVLDLPEAQDSDVDYDAECGLLPEFVHLRELLAAEAATSHSGDGSSARS